MADFLGRASNLPIMKLDAVTFAVMINSSAIMSCHSCPGLLASNKHRMMTQLDSHNTAKGCHGQWLHGTDAQ